MPYSQEAGYTPASVQTILLSLIPYVNAQFETNYTSENFIGSNHYKNYYALAQEMQKHEIAASEIFVKLLQYITVTNQRISRPVTTTPGIVEKLSAEGYVASLKPMVEEDAGKIHICVDLNADDEDYAETKVELCQLISRITVGGAVTMGDQVETIVLSNGQSFDFKYALPNRIPVALRLTVTLSENNQLVIGDPDETKLKLLQNILDRYRLGLKFEPQRYFSLADTPWASQILLEWTDDLTDGVIDETPAWNTTVFDSEFDDLFSVSLDLIELVEE